MLLLPTHRDRPSSAMYPAAILENGQVVDPDCPLLQVWWPGLPSLHLLGFLYCPVCLLHSAIRPSEGCWVPTLDRTAVALRISNPDGVDL